MKKKRGFLSQTQYIAYGFFVLILVGTLLLMLPFASRNGQSVNFLDALFTSTSASCVTGLVVRDTWSQWSLFGQFVIIFLIQIGGLGFVTVGVFFSIVLRRKIGLRQRGLIQESTSALQIGGIVKLARRIIAGTCIFEVTGAVLLSIRFVPKYGFFRGVFYGFFHAVSAFCNAGFSTLPGGMGNPAVMQGHNLLYITLGLLIALGGIGFPILVNLYETVAYYLQAGKFWLLRRSGRFRKKVHLYNLNTKIVLVATVFLLIGGTLAIAALEWNHSFAGMPVADKWVHAFFNSSCPRTAGFASVGLTSLSTQTLLLMVVLMMIGGGTQSTAGGVKVNVFAVVLINLWAVVRGADRVAILRRELSHDSIRRSNAALILYLFMVFLAIFLLSVLEPEAGLLVITFECVSALSTVGSSLDLTPTLGNSSKLLVILLMYIGRVGAFTLLTGLVRQEKKRNYRYPSDNIIIN